MASFKQLLDTNVTKAFNLIGDLAEDIKLKTVTSTDFDFSTSTTTTTNDTQITIKGVVSKVYNSEGADTKMLADIIIKSKDISIDTIDNYDVVFLRGKDWNIKTAEDNGYVITLTVSKGGNS